MKTYRGVLAVGPAAPLFIATFSSSDDRTEKAAATADPVAFHQEMRALWTDHVAWLDIIEDLKVSVRAGGYVDPARLTDPLVPLEERAGIGVPARRGHH